ncbi:hypothetical protein LLG39_16180 [bacterium]|nr:hypothetical protein [bacterium]
MHAGVLSQTVLLTKCKNITVWQRFDRWLMVTEDQTDGRVCYFFDPVTHSRLNFKNALPGAWIPMGSAIKWLMYVDHYQGFDRLMAHDVDWQTYHVVREVSRNQIPCGMVGNKCFFGEYRAAMSGDHYPVDIYWADLERGGCYLFCASDSDKSQFAHDGNLMVYRAYNEPGDVRICGYYFNGTGEFEIVRRDGIEPSVCGNLVAWAEANGSGWNIVAKDLSTGELRTITYTTANPPRPEAGKGAIFWQASSSTTGLDIYGYDWATGTQFTVTSASGNQTRLRVCNDLVTWVSGLSPSEILYGAYIASPSQITDLRASAITDSSVYLTWTSVGAGTSYDLRMRTDAPITTDNWATSTPINGLPAPGAAGQTEKFITQPLSPEYHYFALKATLSSGVTTPLSNSICVYIPEHLELPNTCDGVYVSFTGVVSGIGSDGAVYCQRDTGVGAVRAVPLAVPTSVGIGDNVIVTGKLIRDDGLCGPVLAGCEITPLGSTAPVRCLAMSNKCVGGAVSIVDGNHESGPLANLFALTKTWGRVSGFSKGIGCSFYINDGSISGEPGAHVICPYAPPTGLTDGSFVVVEGIQRVSRSDGREIEVVRPGAIALYAE